MEERYGNKNKTATALLALWLCIYPVFGAQITVSEYDRDTQMASVGGMSEYEYVTIQVTKGGDVYFESQQDTQEGAFLFEFMLEGNFEEEIAVKNRGTGDRATHRNGIYLLWGTSGKRAACTD